jgi:RimJ/RimL family protein N-acetyltransferase
MTFDCYSDQAIGGYRLSGVITDVESASLGKDITRRAIEKVADAIAERFLADHLQEVLAYLDPQAVANLAVADAAGAIREMLAKKLPDKVLEVIRTEREVYQRGVFGGMTRIR